jgi:hypothetical protein
MSERFYCKRATCRAARRNATLRGEVKGIWRGANAKMFVHDAVRPNKRDRSPFAETMRIGKRATAGMNKLSAVTSIMRRQFGRVAARGR